MSTGSRPFIDTNVCLYLLSGDAAKADRSERVIGAGGVASVQVLNEFVSVARAKLALDWSEIRQTLDALAANLDIVALTPTMQRRALDIAERFGFHIYDATIVAAALESGCDKILTEDLQRAQSIDGLRIENPYFQP